MSKDCRTWVIWRTELRKLKLKLKLKRKTKAVSSHHQNNYLILVLAVTGQKY